MKRFYNIEWYPTKDGKYGNPVTRKSVVHLNHPCGETNIDAKNALNIFLARNGNLKKNTVVRIQEFGEKGKIGEDILPMEDKNAILPMTKE